MWLFLAVATPAAAQVSIEAPWVRATAPGAKVGGGYLTVVNQSGAADRLVGASSPAAGRVELHVHVREGEVMKMRQVEAFDIPASGRFEAKPGGPHFMFFDLKAPFKEGDKVPATLRFEKAGEVKVEFPVGRIGQMGPMHHDSHKKH
jgi:copper(I)-binding protein